MSPTTHRLRLLALTSAALGLSAAVTLAGPCFTCDPGTGPFAIGWRAERRISAVGASAHAPRIDVDHRSSTTFIAIVWEDRSTGDGDIILATSDDDGCTWTSRTVTAGAADDRLPDVSVCAWTDVLTIVFNRAGAVYAVTSVDRAATFTLPVVVNAAAATDSASAPRVAGVRIDGVMHHHVAWAAAGALHHGRATGAAPGVWTSSPALSAAFAGLGSWTSPDISADASSSDPATQSGVVIVALARSGGRGVDELYAIRSNGSGSEFYGDPVDPTSRDRPLRVSDTRPDDPSLSIARPLLDGSDDGSGEFYPWNAVLWTEPVGGSPTCKVDARAEEGAGPSRIADWNDPDPVIAGPAVTAAGLAVVPNPLGRPPTPELHAFTEITAAGGREIDASRGRLDPAATPTAVIFCGPDRVTGLDPLRASGAVVSGSWSVDEDLSAVYAAWADSRDGATAVYFKRTDSTTSPPTALGVAPGACAPDPSLEIAWTAPFDPPHCDVDHYRVAWGTVSGVYDWSIEVTGATRATLGGLDHLTTYYVLVTTVDEACNERSALQVSGVSPNCTGTPPCPNPVGNTVLAWRNGSDVMMVWDAPPVDTRHGPALSYDVYRSIDRAADGYTLLGNVTPASTTDGGAVPATPSSRHYYEVVAVNDCGTSNDEPLP